MSKLHVTVEGHEFVVEVGALPRNDEPVTLTINGTPLTVSVSSLDGPEAIEWAVVGVHPYELSVDPDLRWIDTPQGRYQIQVRDLEATVTRPRSGDGRVKAPIPGRIVRVLVEPGQTVQVGQPVVVLEAMKMENEIQAPRAGTVSDLHVSPGQTVKLHELLVEIS